MDLPNGIPRRLTKADIIEQSPAWSPDGEYIAYVTWTDRGGSISRVRADGAFEPELLTQDNAFYDRLTYTPDGSKLIAARATREDKLKYGQDVFPETELVWLPATGGKAISITPLKTVNRLGWPHFSRVDPSRVYFYHPGEGLVGVRLDGNDRQMALHLKDIISNVGLESEDDVQLSPDGRLAVITARFNVYLINMPTDESVPTLALLSLTNSSVPIRRISAAGGFWPYWASDSKTFTYSLGHSIFIYDSVTSGPVMPGVAIKPEGALPVACEYEPVRFDPIIVAPKDRPVGTVALRGATVLTMNGREIIENSDVVVIDNRIAAIGEHGSIEIPLNAKIIDLTGKTILPGWVDIHFHSAPAFGVHSPQSWEYLVSLAYGVTTHHDPSAWSTDKFTYMDRLETGDMLGPRLFTTGQTVFENSYINSFEDARAIARRHAEFDNTQTLKRHFSGSRIREEWLVMAAHEFRLTVTAHEVRGNIKNFIPIILEGNSGIEHTIQTFPLYQDVIQLLTQSGITYTPTFLVAWDVNKYFGEHYFYTHSNAQEEKRLQRFLPPQMMEYVAARSQKPFEGDYSLLPQFAASAAKIIAAGGRVALGSHGQLPGLGVQWELWAMAMGGMPAYDVLRVGTIIPAEAIGHDRDFGSLEVGKLADLQILDKNPLDDIHNTNSLQYVMKNGRLYEAETLKEIWPCVREIERMWWDDNPMPDSKTASRS
jgi:imidazolonepropionase-like amidohydrolase